MTAMPRKKIPYTVLLQVPGQLQERAGKIDTFLAHVETNGIKSAIALAQSMALTLHAGSAWIIHADDFEPLLVLEGHHDPLVF
jgi:hypothetical protein